MRARHACTAGGAGLLGESSVHLQGSLVVAGSMQGCGWHGLGGC